MKKLCIILLILTTVLFTIPLILYAQQSGEADRTGSELKPLIERYSTDMQLLYRSYNIPMSSLAAGKIRSYLADTEALLEKTDFNSLSKDGKIDYVLFNGQLKYRLRSLDLEAARIAEDAKLVPFYKTIVTLAEDLRLMKWIDPEKAADILFTLSQEIETLLKMKQDGSVKKTLALRAAGRVRRLQRALKGWFTFCDGYDPLFTWWAEKPYQKTDELLKKYAEFLRKDIAGVKGDGSTGPIIGDPVGRESLMNDLARSMIPYTPEELIGIGKKEYTWCEAEMKKASRELGYGGDWLKALEYVKTLHVAPGKQPELIRSLAYEAIDFVKKHDLITIPPLMENSWRMEMMTPRRQLVNPFFTGGEVISVSYPTNTMEHEQKMMSLRGNNPHFARATVFHELIPGHHMQGFMTSRYKAYRRPFYTPFWLEGWALHWEMLMWDLNFQKSPENRIGMLFWRMHRCARIVFSLSFHLEKMTAQECIDYLVSRVGHEYANAEAEVRRSFAGGYPPLYQCAYLLGGLQIRALYKDLTGSGKMTPKQFHDAVMRENSIPIEMLRAKLADLPVSKDYKQHWRFYDSLK